jgi:hypothetical protein
MKNSKFIQIIQGIKEYYELYKEVITADKNENFRFKSIDIFNFTDNDKKLYLFFLVSFLISLLVQSLAIVIGEILYGILHFFILVLIGIYIAPNRFIPYNGLFVDKVIINYFILLFITIFSGVVYKIFS